MSQLTETEQTWVAQGPAGAIGTIRRSGDAFRVRLLSEDAPRGPFENLEVAKRALHAAMGSGAERPEFREH